MRSLQLILTQHWRSLVLGLYSLCGLVGLWNHAMWRDELNVWTIARDSDSLADLFAAINYEGHPGLWYLLLYGVQFLTQNPFGMQLLHGAIAALAGWLFLAYAPFQPIQKTVFLFGYFPFFEYFLISRNYNLGILALFAVCVLFSRRRRSYWELGILLALGANTSAYCLFLTGAIALTLAIEYCFPKVFAFQTQARQFNVLGSLVIYSIGVIAAFAQLLPPADSYLHGGNSLRLGFHLYRFLDVLAQVWVTHTLVVQPSERFLDVTIFGLLSAGLLLFFGTLLRDRPIILCLYILGNLEILGFAYLKFAGGLRHYGHLYILLILCLWLAQNESMQTSPQNNVHEQSTTSLISSSARFSSINQKTGRENHVKLPFLRASYPFVFNLMLGLQLVMGLITFTNDFITPYSASKATARYIQAQNLENYFIVGNPDMVMTPISGYLNRPIYRAETQDLGSYVLFKQGRGDASHTEVLKQIKNLLTQSDRPILLILNRELETEPHGLDVKFLKYFPDGVIHDEEFYLYTIHGNAN
ncbi:MAG: hypothetical protein F6J87_04000 [Spirulina sp. SIO3F2]|nr:hypothetical protein [Spirulina sp. SIO3F2]